MPPPSFEPREHKGAAGPIFSIIVILFLMIAGAVYFWNVSQEQKTDAVPFIPASESTTTNQ
jgi:hypothetical protein